jgi:flagellar L-ring protein FlgH
MTRHVRVTLALVSVAAVGALCAPAGARSLWPGSDDGQPRVRSLVADPIAHREGDILTILISESTTASNQAASSSDQTVSGGMSAGQGLLSFIPFFSFGAEDGYDAKGSQSWQGTLTTRMTAQVMKVTEAGLLQIEGTRTVSVNGEKQILVLKGVVRPQDIARDNTIRSDQIADAAINYEGAGPIGQKVKPGILTRLFDWLF